MVKDVTAETILKFNEKKSQLPRALQDYMNCHSFDGSDEAFESVAQFVAEHMEVPCEIEVKAQMMPDGKLNVGVLVSPERKPPFTLLN